MAPEQLIAACDLAASIVHIPKETLALGMLHYHAITVADPLDELRASRLQLMSEAAELVHAIIDPELDSDAEPPMTDAPEGALSDPERVLIPVQQHANAGLWQGAPIDPNGPTAAALNSALTSGTPIDPEGFVDSLKRRFGKLRQ